MIEPWIVAHVSRGAIEAMAFLANPRDHRRMVANFTIAGLIELEFSGSETREYERDCSMNRQRQSHRSSCRAISDSQGSFHVLLAYDGFESPQCRRATSSFQKAHWKLGVPVMVLSRAIGRRLVRILVE